VTAASGDIDVHLVTHPYANQALRLPSTRTYLSPGHQLTALAAACTALSTITAILTPLRDQLNLTSQAQIFLLGAVGIGRIGGLVPALFAGVFGALLLNYCFIPPVHQLSIANPNNVIALVVSRPIEVAHRCAHMGDRKFEGPHPTATPPSSQTSSPCCSTRWTPS
jgi:two-component system, OmpR family, sensor histidine kinase KdpD